MSTSCARGHDNSPSAKFCGICGLAMVQASVLATPAQRSLLLDAPAVVGGVLEVGAQRFELGDLAVVGRLPDRFEGGPNVQSVVVDEPGVSGVHATFRVVGWETELTDLGSTNGTYVWDSGRDAWHRVTSPVIVTDGAAISFGSVAARFWQTA